MKIRGKKLKAILLIVYVIFIILLCVLLFFKNDNDFIEFKNNIYVYGKEFNNNYDEDTLLKINKVLVSDLNVGDEVLVSYIDENNYINFNIIEVSSVEHDEIVVTGNKVQYDSIIGVVNKSYNGLGAFFSVMMSKFFIVLVIFVPSLIFIIYELTLWILKSKKECDLQNELDEINGLTQQLSLLKEKNEKLKNNDINELMNQLECLRTEYDDMKKNKILLTVPESTGVVPVVDINEIYEEIEEIKEEVVEEIKEEVKLNKDFKKKSGFGLDEIDLPKLKKLASVDVDSKKEEDLLVKNVKGNKSRRSIKKAYKKASMNSKKSNSSSNNGKAVKVLATNKKVVSQTKKKGK